MRFHHILFPGDSWDITCGSLLQVAHNQESHFLLSCISWATPGFNSWNRIRIHRSADRLLKGLKPKIRCRYCCNYRFLPPGLKLKEKETWTWRLEPTIRKEVLDAQRIVGHPARLLTHCPWNSSQDWRSTPFKRRVPVTDKHSRWNDGQGFKKI